MKLIPNEEYERLFDLAIKDHNQALALIRQRRSLLQPREPITIVAPWTCWKTGWQDMVRQSRPGLRAGHRKGPQKSPALDRLG